MFHTKCYTNHNTSFVFSFPFIMFALLFSLRPSRNSDPWSHSEALLPPLRNGSCLAFLSQEISALCSLVDSLRIEPTLATRLAVATFFFLQIDTKAHPSGIRAPGSTLV